MKQSLVTSLCILALAGCAFEPPVVAGGQPARPAFKDTAIGLATVSSLMVVMDIKRQQTQDTLKKQSNPQGIAKYQSRLTAIDAVKGNLVNYTSGQLSLGDKISLVNATSDLVKARLPDYSEVIATLSTLSQVLLTAQQQARTAQ